MKQQLTEGKIQKTLLVFAGPMILGNLLQQCYNIADTLIVGQFLGAGALAAVGSAYTLMTFLTSIVLGMCMGSGSVFSFYFGRKEKEKMKEGMFSSFLFVGAVTVVVNIIVFLWIDPILKLLQVPADIYVLMRDYTWAIFWGIFFVFLYNYFAFLLRAVGNSVTPLLFLAISSVLNIVLDILFISEFHMGVRGGCVGDGDRTGIRRGRNRGLYMAARARTSFPGRTETAVRADDERDDAGDRAVLSLCQYTAVGHELWDSDDTGACK